MRDAELLDQEYEPREEMSDLQQHLGGEVGTARVLFSPARGRYEREGRHDVTMLTDGSALAAVSYGSLSWLVPEILKTAGRPRCSTRRTLRESVREAADRLLRAVSAAPTPS